MRATWSALMSTGTASAVPSSTCAGRCVAAPQGTWRAAMARRRWTTWPRSSPSWRAAAVEPLAGVGVGTPGLVDTATGVVRWAVGLEWRDVPVGPRLAELTGLPVIVVNDSQAAAMGEWAFGRHDASSAMIVVKVGEGIGAGIVIGGRLYPGDDAGAGEIGHTRVGEGETPCRCGGQGCLETVASLRAVLDRARALVPDHPESLLARGPLTRETLLDAFRAGDTLARQVVLESARPLGRVLGAMIGTLGAREVVLVGPMTAFGQPWLEEVRAETQRSALALLVEQSSIHLGTTGHGRRGAGGGGHAHDHRAGLGVLTMTTISNDDHRASRAEDAAGRRAAAV